MVGSDISEKSLLEHVTPDILKMLNSPLNFQWPLKFLSILHQTHSNSPFYWKMHSVNNRSIPNYTKYIPGYPKYVSKVPVSEIL
jgi:hypothetical protein